MLSPGTINAFQGRIQTRYTNKTLPSSITKADHADSFNELSGYLLDLLPNGILTGLDLSLSGSNVLIQPGTWMIDSFVYSIISQQSLPIDAQDATYSRYDVLYADDTGNIHLVSGSLSLTPLEPSVPNDTIKLGSIFITPTTVTITPPPLTGYVDTTTNQPSIHGLKNFMDGIQSVTRPLGDSTLNVATTQYVQNELADYTILPALTGNTGKFLTTDGTNVSWATVSSGGGTWGTITGTLSSQADLQTALNAKQATGNYITALTGDATASGPNSVAITLATVNTNTGSWGNASSVATFTVNGKGLITAAGNTAIQIAESQVTNLTSDLAAKQATLGGTGLVKSTSGTISYDTNTYLTTGNAATTYMPLAGGILTGPITLSADAVSALQPVSYGQFLNWNNGFSWKHSVIATTTGALPAYTTSGSFLVLTATANGAFPAQDGVTLVLNDNVLVKNEAGALRTNNGGYTLTQVGDAGTPWILTRMTDSSSSSQLLSATYKIREGSTQSFQVYTVNVDPIVLGTTQITFALTGGAGTYLNGTGITLAGNVFGLDTAFTKGLLSATSPIFYNSSTGVISSQASSGSQNGYLTSADWTTFNNKQAALGGTGFVKSTSGTISYDTSSYLPLTLTGNTTLANAGFTLTFGNLQVSNGPVLANDVARLGDLELPNALISGANTTTVTTTATTTAGTWRINNLIYSTGTSTNTTIPAQDATLSRYVLIYGTTSNTILGINGTLSTDPIEPTQPANTAILASILITPSSVTVSGGGRGTVTKVSGVNTNGFFWSIANSTSTPALTLRLQNASTTLDGQLIHADWNTFNNKLSNVLTTTGDIIYSSSGTTAARLGIGGANTVLHGGTTPSYSGIAIADIITTGGTAGSTTYLRGDGQWSTVSGSNIYTADGTLTGNRTVSTSSGFTLTFSPPIIFNASITAASSLARGNYTNQTLIAAANNDVLIADDINPVFTAGGFTGVATIGQRIQMGTFGVGILATPGAPSCTPSITAGSLAAGTYYYKIVAFDVLGRTTLAGSETASTVSSGTTGKVILTWSVVPYATGYRVYRGTSSNGQSVYYTVNNNVNGAPTFTDTGAANTAGTVPIVNGTVVSAIGTDGTVNGINLGYGNNQLNNNLVFGYTAGNAITTGTSNIFIGALAGVANTTGTANAFIGYQAGQTNISNSQCTFIGNQAGRLSVADNNSAVGYQAGFAITGGTGNTFFGSSAGQAIQTGNYNTFMGNAAGYFVSAGSTGNTFIGNSAGSGFTSAVNFNTGVGDNVMNQATTGGNNACFGYNSGRNIQASGAACTSLDNSICIGAQANPLANSQTNQIVIGYSVYGQGSNSTSIGNSSTTLCLLYGVLNSPVGATASKNATVGGKIKEYFTDAGNTTTTETDLYSYTTEASMLSVNGTSIQAEYGGVFVSSATATREIKVYFGGTVIYDSGALSVTTSSQWAIYTSLIRVSGTVIRYMVSIVVDGVTLTSPCSAGELTGLTLSNTNVLKITGQAAATGAATNDIVGKLGAVYYWPVSV